MPGDEDPTRSEIITTIPLMVRGVTEKHTCQNEARACEEQWQQCSGSKHIEDTEVSAGGRGTEESVVWSRSRRSCGRKMVEKVGGGVKALCPEARGQEGLDQKSAHDIFRGPNDALCLAVHTQLNTSGEKGAGGAVVELTTLSHWTALM
jgi:hypothetical protein